MADVDRLKDIKYSEQIKLLLDHYEFKDTSFITK